MDVTDLIQIVWPPSLKQVIGFCAGMWLLWVICKPALNAARRLIRHSIAAREAIADAKRAAAPAATRICELQARMNSLRAAPNETSSQGFFRVQNDIGLFEEMKREARQLARICDSLRSFGISNPLTRLAFENPQFADAVTALKKNQLA